MQAGITTKITKPKNKTSPKPLFAEAKGFNNPADLVDAVNMLTIKKQSMMLLDKQEDSTDFDGLQGTISSPSANPDLAFMQKQQELNELVGKIFENHKQCELWPFAALLIPSAGGLAEHQR